MSTTYTLSQELVQALPNHLDLLSLLLLQGFVFETSFYYWTAVLGFSSTLFCLSDVLSIVCEELESELKALAILFDKSLGGDEDMERLITRRRQFLEQSLSFLSQLSDPI